MRCNIFFHTELGYFTLYKAIKCVSYRLSTLRLNFLSIVFGQCRQWKLARCRQWKLARRRQWKLARCRQWKLARCRQWKLAGIKPVRGNEGRVCSLSLCEMYQTCDPICNPGVPHTHTLTHTSACTWAHFPFFPLPRPQFPPLVSSQGCVRVQGGAGRRGAGLTPP
jgi:hypothetical protein